jgi:hypothetical protein
MRCNVIVSFPCVPGLFDLVGLTCSLSSYFLVFFNDLLGHLVHVETVYLSKMSRCPVLESVDGTNSHTILDVLQGSASE